MIMDFGMSLFLLNSETGTGADRSEEKTILDHSDVPWEELENGWRRQVLFSGELTLVVLEAQGPSDGPIPLHHHVHDQISYLVEGKIEVKIGDEQRQIGEGGFYRVPSGVAHGIRILSKSLKLIDVFSPPREDFRPK
jgi:quercetin dioxygenase-like cupin family protein